MVEKEKINRNLIGKAIYCIKHTNGINDHFPVAKGTILRVIDVRHPNVTKYNLRVKDEDSNFVGHYGWVNPKDFVLCDDIRCHLDFMNRP